MRTSAYTRIPRPPEPVSPRMNAIYQLLDDGLRKLALVEAQIGFGAADGVRQNIDDIAANLERVGALVLEKDDGSPDIVE